MSDKLNKSKRKFDYKWVIVAISILMVFASMGFSNGIKSAFLKPVCEALAIDRFSFSFVDSIRYAATTAVNLFFGVLIKRFGSKKLILCGFSALAISQLFFAFSKHIVLFYIGGAFLGIGLSFTSTSMVGYVINRWCKENKGTVTGAALAASGLGGAVASQVITPIIYRSGYNYAYLTVAIVYVAIAVIMLVLHRDNPKDSTDPHPDIIKQDTPKKAKKASTEWSGLTVRQTTHSWYFYALVFIIFITGIALQAPNTVWHAHSSDVGIDKSYIDLVLGISSLTLAAFKFATGFLNDKCGVKVTNAICSSIGAIVIFLLAFATNSLGGKVIVMIYGVFVSFAFPLETVMLPVYARDMFGERSFSFSLGVFAAANAAGCALGGPIINMCYELIGGYKIPLIACGIVMAISLASFFIICNAAFKKRKEIEALEPYSVKGEQNV